MKLLITVVISKFLKCTIKCCTYKCQIIHHDNKKVSKFNPPPSPYFYSTGDHGDWLS